MFITRRLAIATFAAVAVLGLAATPALGGPPFICHAFELSGSPSLPWGTNTAAGWNNPAATYDITHLTVDVPKLLASGMPVSARMETMRRATIYAAKDRAIAANLLLALEARAKANPNDPNALFDAGFLIEAYGQASRVYEWDMLQGRAKQEWTFRKEPVGTGVKLIDAALAFNPPEAPAMRRARLMLASK